MSPAASETGLAADGNPLADGGWEPETEEADTPTAVLEHPADDRLRLTISTTSSLQPNTAVELTIEGVAREAIDGGEVVLALPTRAIIDYRASDTGVPEVPAKARWDLPAIAKGGTWSETFTVPGEAAGYYSVMVNAYTHGPDGGPWLFDDVSRSAWMFVSGTDGQLTRLFEDSLGPAASDDTLYSRSDPTRPGTNWHRDSVYVQVLYYNNWQEGFKPAVDMRILAVEYETSGGTKRVRRSHPSQIVPEDGIVAFGCPPTPTDRGVWLEMHGSLYETRYTERAPRGYRPRYSAAVAANCGRLKTHHVDHNWYVPWRHLNVGGERISEHLWHYRENPVDWNVNFDEDYYTSRYNPFTDKITLWANFTREGRALYVASHEYAHALHHKALGGMWWVGLSCFNHFFSKITGVRCALQEGFAQYAGNIGSDGYYEDCFEHFGDPTKPGRPDCRREADHGKKPKIEGHVAALLLDLTDDESERGDFTEYSGVYIAMIFKTCKVRNRYWVAWTPLTGNVYVYKWWKRTNVSNIVWCLENQIDKRVHEDVFPYVRTPVDVKHRATEYEPDDWDILDIRTVWLKNLKSY